MMQTQRCVKESASRRVAFDKQISTAGLEEYGTLHKFTEIFTEIFLDIYGHWIYLTRSRP
jgi:hypothetical protein